MINWRGAFKILVHIRFKIILFTRFRHNDASDYKSGVVHAMLVYYGSIMYHKYIYALPIYSIIHLCVCSYELT